ncbi:recombinase family protein [Anaerosinus massiliensis]|uniref:recombinase family protein n=1 Tax=Massilibacillus massiliensis TaxID=1806837 RepID=UPI000DA60844|nr:recombinase family protein [Massilibacillus massiliensis]
MSTFIYCRGNDEQVEKQLILCKEKANLLGFTDIKCYIDKNCSSNDHRKEFSNMINELEKNDNENNIVVTVDASRLYRNLSKLVEFENKYKVCYISDDSPMIHSLIDVLEKERNRVQ